MHIFSFKKVKNTKKKTYAMTPFPPDDEPKSEDLSPVFVVFFASTPLEFVVVPPRLLLPPTPLFPPEQNGVSALPIFWLNPSSLYLFAIAKTTIFHRHWTQW